LSDIVVGNDEEFAVLDGCGQGKELARKLAANGKVSIYKMGGDGSVTYHDDDTFETGVFRVQPLKPVGAGDAFMGAFIMGLVDGLSLRESVRRGSANAALVVSRVGCAPAMATVQEITDFIAQHKGNS
jgi:5-dehydro-2-deoxygluconokinase